MKEIAHVFYDTYIEHSGGLNYQGLPCPKWGELPEAIREHWRAVERKAEEMYGAPSSG